MPTDGVRCHPLTPERWDDYATLFGPRGACAGCWCRYWHQTGKEFEAGKGDTNREEQKAVVDAGQTPGLIAYVEGEPAGWCAVEPRSDLSRLSRSRILAPVDDRPVWSVVCFFVAKAHRGRGLTVDLLRAVIEHVRRQPADGEQIIEGYPVEPKKLPMPAAFAYHGLAAAFRKAGFVEVARRSETRPIMRYVIEDP